MRILLTLSLFLVFSYLPVEAKVSVSLNSILQNVEVFGGITRSPVQPSRYDLLNFIAQDEDTEFNETPFCSKSITIKKTFRNYLVVPVFGCKSCPLNLITFGTDSSPPVS